MKITRQHPSRQQPALSLGAGLEVFRVRRLLLSRGFTLVEICIAMGLCMMLLGIATLSISGLQDEAKLKRHVAEVERTARRSLQEAIFHQRPVELALESALGSDGGQVQVKRLSDENFRPLRRGEVWEFHPTGVCEPIEIRVMNPAGSIELAFDPLTACVVRKSISVKS